MSSVVDYSLINRQLAALVETERDAIANMANCSALLYHSLVDINWVGFYLCRGDDLVLGPFQGNPACTRIPLGKGVCGTAAVEQKSLIVADVDAFPGHIACDSASRSELVVPLIDNQQLIGVLDIDSPILGRFDSADQAALEQLVDTLRQGCHFFAV